MSDRIYPKATAPLTWAVYEAANARAERWMRRYQDMSAKYAALEKELEVLKNGK